MILAPFKSLYKPLYAQFNVLYLPDNHLEQKKNLTYIYKCSIPTYCTTLLYYQLIPQHVSA
jgi:hypothetical protein